MSAEKLRRRRSLDRTEDEGRWGFLVNQMNFLPAMGPRRSKTSRQKTASAGDGGLRNLW